jgi:hypothetical protein
VSWILSELEFLNKLCGNIFFFLKVGTVTGTITFSKVGTGTITFSKVGTGTVKNSYGSTTLLGIDSWAA